jgi:AraC-like DNA-binding protein
LTRAATRPKTGDVKPTSSVRVLFALLAVLERAGVDRRRFLADVGIDETVLADDEGRVSFERLEHAWESAPEWTNDSDFGLHFAEQTSMGAFDVVDYAAQSSACIGDAFDRLARYQRLLHDAVRLAIEVRGDSVHIEHRVDSMAQGIPRHAAEAAIASWVLRARALTKVEIAPIEVSFRHAAPRDCSEHHRILRCPIRFESETNALVLSRQDFARPITTSDSRLGALLDRHAELILARLPPHDGLVTDVRAALTEAMKSGDASLAAIAKRLGKSTRTLQRRLADEGIRFDEVLEALRRELAFRYLAEPALSIGEVAFLLGYSDTTAFHRAFKRWAGETPQSYRRKARSP